MKQWFEIKVQADDPSVADVNVFDFIGDWIDELWGGFDGVITAKSFVAELEKLPEAVRTIRVHINSPGGDVFGALNIANALRDQRASRGRKVETIVEGLAASAASVIVMAGDPVRMSDNALLMIHNPWTYAIGEAADMQKAAEELDKVRNTLVTTYQWHSELDDGEIKALMDAVTWMDADDAIDKGFADEVVEGLSAMASIHPLGLKHAHVAVPEKYAERVAAFVRQPDAEPEPVLAPVTPAAKAPDPAPVKPEPSAARAVDVVDQCGAAGLGVEFAQKLLGENVTAEDLGQLVSAERERLDAEARRDENVRALFKEHNMDVLGGYLAGAGVSVEAAKSIVTEITAAIDLAEIDAGLGPDPGARRKSPVMSYEEIYARLNTPTAS